MKPNRQYFVVEIDKEAQTDRRSNLSLKNVGYLGIRYAPESKDIKGLLVSNIEPDSPALKAGFVIGDIVHSINTTTIHSFNDAVAEITRHAPGEDVTITYTSAITGTSNTKTVKLGSKTVKLVLSQVKEMEYNLQYGKIVHIGKRAANDFPQAEIGDILLFHHNVEYKPRSEGDRAYNDWHHVGNTGGGNELRIAAYDNEVFGVLKVQDKRIYPHRKYVFCHPHIQKASFQQSNGIWLPDAWEAKQEDYQRQIEELQAQLQEVRSSTILREKENEHNYRRQDEIKTIMRALHKEMRQITRKMHQPRLVEATVIFFNPESSDILGCQLEPGEKLMADMYTLYPLEVFGINYALARVGHIEAVIRPTTINPEIFLSLNTTDMQQMPTPLHDRVLVLPAPAETVTASGIIIPDTAQEKPVMGTVIAVGPGRPGEPMQAKLGDQILYSRMSGTELEVKLNYTFTKQDGSDFKVEGDKFLILREDEIFIFL